MSRTERAEYFDEERLDRLVASNPSEAIDEATAWVESAGEDPEVAALAQSALGRSLFELGEMRRAANSMNAALARAKIVTDHSLRVRVAMSAAAVLAETGSVDDARSALVDIESEITDAQAGRYETQRSFVEYHAGRLTSAVVHADRAEPALRANHDDLGLLRLQIHRGVVLLQQGRLAEAAGDFEAAETLAIQLGADVARAQVNANQAVVLGRARRIPESLQRFAQARELYEGAGEPGRSMSVLEIDRAEVLMHAGLLVDAIDAAMRALELVDSSGNQVFAGDACLVLARAQLAGARYTDAERSARRASELLRLSGRPAMVAHATAISACALLAKSSAGDDAVGPLAAAVEVIDDLEREGWMETADQVRVARVRCGRRTLQSDVILADVRLLAAKRSDPSRHVAVAGWFAEAVRCEIDDDRQGAYAACRSGLTLVDEIAAEAVSLEERSAAMQTGADLSQVAIDVAIAARDADTVLAAADGTRARSLRDELVDRRRHRSLSPEAADDMRALLSSRLGPRTLVEWVVARNRVWAVVFDAHGSRLVDVGDRRTIVRARDRLGMWLDIAATEPDASTARARRAAARLDALLVEPLELPVDEGVVLVPTDLLHGIPWSSLPTLSSRPVALVPNAQLWIEADRRADSRAASVGVVIGPEIDNSELEVDSMVEAYDDVVVVAGALATAEVANEMFRDLDIVHIAAHGTFRSDHPLLSTLRLDGEATLYDAVPERVNSRLVILSSCEGGAQGTADGSEVLGLSSVLLARGAAAVLAPLTAVRDLECAEFVAEVHEQLASGTPFAAAVAAVRTRWLADDDLSRWAVASSFTCFGSGAVTVAARAGADTLEDG